MTKSINISLFMLVAILMLLSLFNQDRFAKIDLITTWQITALALCLIRFTVLNYIINTVQLRKFPELRGLVGKKWFAISNDEKFNSFDKGAGLMFLSIYGVVITLVFVTGFFVLMEASFSNNSSLLTGGIKPVFFFGLL